GPGSGRPGPVRDSVPLAVSALSGDRLAVPTPVRGGGAEDAAPQPHVSNCRPAGSDVCGGPDSGQPAAAGGDAGGRPVSDIRDRAGSDVPCGGDPLRLAGDASLRPRPVVCLTDLPAGAAAGTDVRPPE